MFQKSIHTKANFCNLLENKNKVGNAIFNRNNEASMNTKEGVAG